MQDPDDRKRWLAVLADLGLEPDPEPAPAAPVAAEPARPVVPPAPAAEVKREEAPDRLAAEPVEEPAGGRGRRKRPQPAVEEALPPIAEAVTAPALPEAAGEEADAMDAGSREGTPGRHRRRRRGGKVSPQADAAVEEESMEPVAAGEPGPEESAEVREANRVPMHALPAAGPEAVMDDALTVPEEGASPAEEGEGEMPAGERDRRRRRRGRGRGRKPETVAEARRPAVEEEVEEEDEEVLTEENVPEETGPRLAEEDEDDFEDLTNLSIPSWADLVASLYRPPDR